MERTGLSRAAIDQLAAVLRRYPQVRRGVLFGSRAKGTFRPDSDIDLALEGDLDDLTIEDIASAMDDLPLPYLFDIKAVSRLRNAALIDHVRRVGVEIYTCRKADVQPDLRFDGQADRPTFGAQDRAGREAGVSTDIDGLASP
jgi:predicted nucleotidyltransferase